jgi:hypothetical protein
LPNFFSGTAACDVTRLARSVSLEILKMGCYFESNLKFKMAALASDWDGHFFKSFPELLHVKSSEMFL